MDKSPIFLWIGGLHLGVIPYNEEDVKLLARLMRAEAEGDGDLGMLMVGNVGVNRVRGDCLDFNEVRSIRQMVFQRPGGFEATIKGYFYQAPRENELRLARRVIKGERFHPSTNSLWFFRPTGACPSQWFNQWNTGRYKSHCFFTPTQEACPSVF